MANSPTQRTLKYLRDKGSTCAIVEHWNKFAGIRQDLWGFCDILELTEDGQTVCVQTTTSSHIKERIDKIKAHKNYPILKKCNWKVMVIGWKKLKIKRGGKNFTHKEVIFEL